MYTCIVNWFCVNLYSELVLCKLVQYIGFVCTCTVNWFFVILYSELVMYSLVVLCTVVQKLILWYLYSKLAFLAMKATLEVQKAVFLSVFVYVGTQFAQNWHTDCTKFACWLHKVCTNFAIHQQLVSIKIKFKLSSSQEPSQCLFLISTIPIFPFCITTKWAKMSPTTNTHYFCLPFLFGIINEIKIFSVWWVTGIST